MFRRRRLRAMGVGGYTELQSLADCGGTTNSQRNADGRTCRGRRLMVMGVGGYTELQSLVECGGTTKSQTKSDGRSCRGRRLRMMGVGCERRVSVNTAIIVVERLLLLCVGPRARASSGQTPVHYE